MRRILLSLAIVAMVATSAQATAYVWWQMDSGPAAALPFNFGYAAGVPEPGTSNATPDLVVTVVRKGDFDWDGAAATGVDDYAYYSIGADPTLVNPVEFWLGDFDLDGAAFTGLDDYDYYKHANVP